MFCVIFADIEQQPYSTDLPGIPYKPIMCIAFPYGRQDALNRGLLSRGWWFIARSPLRLYAFGAVFHALVILTMYLFDFVAGGAQGIFLPGLFILFGVLGWFMLGFVLQSYPKWFRCSKADYSSYGLAYNLAFVSLLIAEAGMFGSIFLNAIALAMLVLAWWISLAAIRWMYQWGYGVKQTVAPYLFPPLKIALWLLIAAVPVSLLNLLIIKKLLLITASLLMFALALGFLRLYYQASRFSSSSRSQP
jgi:hypothetical protein